MNMMYTGQIKRIQNTMTTICVKVSALKSGGGGGGDALIILNGF